MVQTMLWDTTLAKADSVFMRSSCLVTSVFSIPRKSMAIDPSKPLVVPAGMDSLSQIGELLLSLPIHHGLHLL